MIDDEALKRSKNELKLRKTDMLDAREKTLNFLQKDATKDDKWGAELSRLFYIFIDKANLLLVKCEEYCKDLESREFPEARE